MLKLRLVLLLLACTTPFFVAAKTTEDTGSTTCYKSEFSDYRNLFDEAFEINLQLEDADNIEVYINCMSFNQNGELETAVVSGNSSTGDQSVVDFTCKGNTLFASESERAFNTTESTSCFSCATDSSTQDACVTRKTSSQGSLWSSSITGLLSLLYSLS